MNDNVITHGDIFSSISGVRVLLCTLDELLNDNDLTELPILCIAELQQYLQSLHP